MSFAEIILCLEASALLLRCRLGSRLGHKLLLAVEKLALLLLQRLERLLGLESTLLLLLRLLLDLENREIKSVLW